MIEMLMKPKRAERKSWEMFFIGLFYSCFSMFLFSFVFSKDTVMTHYGGILIVTFTTLCCLPFMYYLIKLEEGKDVDINNEGKLVKEHWKALKAMMWMFLGFVVGFSIWYVAFPADVPTNFNAQVEVFCQINSPQSYSACLEKHGFSVTGNVTRADHFLGIFLNNISVLVFTLLFSLVLGAGAIFILVWNASVIGAAVGMFAKDLANLPLGILRYMIHGVPEILAYFVGALAGGIISVAVIRKDMETERKWTILQDAVVLILIAIVILVVAGLIEVFVTPSILNLI